MNCPACPQAPLKIARLDTGMDVDLCDFCGGAWLDKSEIYAFVRQRQKLYDEFAAAFKSLKPSERICPRCAKAMHSAGVQGVNFEVCASCSGTWFDKGEVERLNAALDVQPQTRIPDQSPRGDAGPIFMAGLIAFCAILSLIAAKVLGAKVGLREAQYAAGAALPLMLVGYLVVGRRK